MGVMSEIAIEIYEEVEDLMNDTIAYSHFDACVIVAYERNLDTNLVMELTEDLSE